MLSTPNVWIGQSYLHDTGVSAARRPSRWPTMLGGGTTQRPPSPSKFVEAAQALRRLLAAIDQGEIDADDPKARAFQRRLEGVVAAWEEAVEEGGTVERE